VRGVILLVLLGFPTLAVAQFPYPYILPVQVGTANTSACVFAKNVTSGNIVIAGTSWFSSASAPSVTDTRSTSYTQKVYSSTGSGSVGATIYGGILGSSGPDTVTLSISGATFNQVYCAEFPPSFSLTTDGTDITNFSGNPATITSTGITTTLSGDILISLAGGFHNNSICGPVDARGVPANFKYIALGMARNNDGGCWLYQVTGAAGSYTNSFTNWQNMDQGLVVTVAFKANAMHISTPLAIPNGSLSKTYNYTLGAAGAASTVTWTGTPPPGLSLNSSTGAITGTPTVSNHYSFSVAASDGTTTDTQTLTMDVVTSFGAISVVQTKANTGTLVPPVTFTSNVTAGNTIVVFGAEQVSTFYGGLPMHCFDSLGTVFNRVNSNDMVFDSDQQIFIGIAPSSGADTVSCNSGSSAPFPIMGGIAELANVQNFGDFANVVWATSASPITSTSLTTPVPDSIVLCNAAGRSSSTVFGAQAPFTGVGTAFVAGAYDIVTTVTGYTCTYTMTSNTDGNWMIQAIALRPSAGVVVPPAATGYSVVF